MALPPYWVYPPTVAEQLTLYDALDRSVRRWGTQTRHERRHRHALINAERVVVAGQLVRRRAARRAAVSAPCAADCHRGPTRASVPAD